MGISLQKGANVNLSRMAPSLRNILVGLGWEARATAGEDFDLDASLFMVGASGKVRSEADFIFYNQLQSPCGSVRHTGDNRTGAGEGDDEAIEVYLDKVPAEVQRLVVTVTIHEAEARRQNFGQVRGAFIRLVDMDTDQEVVRFDLSEDYATETAMIFGEIYRYGGEWKFRAVGQGHAGGLHALATSHGVDVL